MCYAGSTSRGSIPEFPMIVYYSSIRVIGIITQEPSLLSNIYYLVTPTHGRDDARRFLVDLTQFVTVAPTDTEAFRYAAFLPLADFEDALQVAAARACGASCIVTRNVKDFAESPIPARTPAEVLSELT